MAENRAQRRAAEHAQRQKLYADTQARGADPIAREALAMMKDQLILVLINRLGGEITVPVAEVDGTGPFYLEMALDPAGRNFTFIVRKKD